MRPTDGLLHSTSAETAPPVLDEVTAFDLPVHGSITRDPHEALHPQRTQPQDRESPTGFGDGCCKAVRAGDGGRATWWYRNRWVRTRAFVEDAKFSGGAAAMRGGPCQPHIVNHAAA